MPGYIPVLLGYTTAHEAKALGCTHHGSYYGIPIWMGDVDSEAPLAFAKWAPLDLLIPVAACIEGLLFPLVHGTDAEPAFMFKVKEPIE
ncbi:hypothetical protein [Pseudomonas nitroreducens]|uniref:hypothetical protein n=1 Tax=Pseudomonas nitroreducens TaxID=46680 RepID=UPI00185197FD|nr:hypothetical protein [Pseudomonas nitroreducens]NNN24367.1 hypothetical protein [Pseudomonas nitroreducens]